MNTETSSKGRPAICMPMGIPWLDMPTGAMREGDRRSTVVFAIYELTDGRFTRIRTARLAGAQESGR